MGDNPTLSGMPAIASSRTASTRRALAAPYQRVGGASGSTSSGSPPVVQNSPLGTVAQTGSAGSSVAVLGVESERPTRGPAQLQQHLHLSQNHYTDERQVHVAHHVHPQDPHLVSELVAAREQLAHERVTAGVMNFQVRSEAQAALQHMQAQCEQATAHASLEAERVTQQRTQQVAAQAQQAMQLHASAIVGEAESRHAFCVRELQQAAEASQQQIAESASAAITEHERRQEAMQLEIEGLRQQLAEAAEAAQQAREQALSAAPSPSLEQNITEGHFGHPPADSYPGGPPEAYCPGAYHAGAGLHTPIPARPVSYTHLTLPTKRIV